MTKLTFVRIAITVTVIGLFSVHGPAIASIFTPVDLGDITNLRIQSKNALYPEGEFLTKFAVPFDIGIDGDNAWGAGDGICGGGGNDGIWNATVNVGVANVKTIYTLANTDWGSIGVNRFSVTANYDNGDSLTWVYTDGQQLRDWSLFPAFATDINGTNTHEVFRVSPPLSVMDPPTPDVLDMQTLFIPEPFHSLTLDTLEFTDLRQTFTHSVFLSGVTLSAIDPLTDSLNPVPILSTFPLFTSTIAVLGFMAFRRNRSRNNKNSTFGDQ